MLTASGRAVLVMALHMPQLENGVKRILYRITISYHFQCIFNECADDLTHLPTRGTQRQFPSHPLFREGNEEGYTRRLAFIAIREITVSRISENAVTITGLIR